MERVRRRWWTALVSLAAVLLVSGALLTALFQLVIMIAPGYRQDIADYVSRVAGQPVDVGGVGLGWRGLAPRLELTDITVYAPDSPDPAFFAERLRLGFGLRRLLGGDTAPTRVELSGVQLYAVIDEHGRFSLRGLDTGGGPSRATQDWLRQLGRFERVRLSRCELLLEDARLRRPLPRFLLTSAEIAFARGRGTAVAELALPPEIGSTVEFEAQIRGDLEQPRTWNGTWNLLIDNLAGLPWLDAHLAPDAQMGFRRTELSLAGSLVGGALGPMDLQLDAGELLGRRGEREASLRSISAHARLLPELHGWVADFDRLQISGVGGPWPATRVRVSRQDDPLALTRSLDVAADYLRLDDLTPWVELFPEIGTAAEMQRLRGVTGSIRNLVVRSQDGDQGPRFSLRAALDGLTVPESAQLPGFSGLSGDFSASESSGRLQLREAPFELRYPKVIGVPATFERISGELGWVRTAEGWTITSPRFGWQLDGSRGQGELELFLPGVDGGSPRLHLDARFSAADITRLKPYMPLHWGQDLRNWLTRAVESGRSPAARLRIDGDLADFPFVEGPGLFALELDVADTRLAFAPDWPALEGLAGHLEFTGQSLAIRGDAGTLSGNRVEAIEARIDNFRDARLAITGEVQGDAARFYDFLRASPLAARLSGLLGRTRASGETTAQVRLDIPLHRVRDTEVAGDIRLRGVRMEVQALPEPITDIRGDLAFDRHGVRGSDLAGRAYDTPASATLSHDEAGLQRLSARFEFAPDAGGAGISRLLPGFLRSNARGSSQWQLDMPLNGPQAGLVMLNSDLRGLALSLPQPLAKPAEASWPLALSLQGENQFPLRLALDMGERLGGDLAFARGQDAHLHLQRARFRLGAGPAPHAGDDGIFITGTVTDLEPTRWGEVAGGAAAASAGTPGAALPLQADLNVGHLWLGRQRVDGVRLAFATLPAGWQVRLAGNGAEGELAYRPDPSGGTLGGRLEHLHLAYRAVPGGSTEAEGAFAPEPVAEPMDPARLPRLDLAVDDFQIGTAVLGRLDLRTARIADGQRIERLQTGGAGSEISASGDWRRVQGRSSARLQFDVRSDAIGEILVGLGYAQSLSAKRSRFSAALQWPDTDPGAARGLEWAQARGRLDMEIDKGMLRAVEPGAGRVLGLINFWALPRRLTLDFRDVVSQGLGFDQIKGSFALGDGVAMTEDLDIDAPSLHMEVRGRVGLAARDYDQRVKVYPDVSAGVTLGALVLGGPVAGALALIAQEVMDQPLDQVGQLSYRLTGTWEDPLVQREGEAAPVAAPAASGAPVTRPAPAAAPAAPPVPLPPSNPVAPP